MNKVLPRTGVTFDGPNVIVCEGYADVQFVKYLLDARSLDNFEIGCPTQSQPEVGADGRSGISDYLTALRVFGTHATNGLDSITVIVDADTSSQASFTDATTWLSKSDFQAPDEPFSWTSDTTTPRTSVLIMPGPSAETGTLEHLLWRVFEDTSKETADCVEQFVACLGGHSDWSDNRKAKMRVHSIIAGRCRNNPASSLSRVWSNDPTIFPLKHSAFDFIADLLDELSTT